MQRITGIATLAAVALTTSGCGSLFYTGQHPSVGYEPVTPHMNEWLRSRIQTVTVVSDESRPTLSVDGDYGEYVPTVGEGAKAGAVMGAQAAGEIIAEDPRTLILMPVILPITMVGGSVAGASAAKIEQELQEFRNGLADELTAEDPDRPMPNERLADEFTVYLEQIDAIELVTEAPDAEIRIAISDIEVITDREDAVVKTYAYAVMTSDKDASVLHSSKFAYAERDSLRNWAADNAARWVPYAENARRYFAAEIAADLFETIHVRHVLRPTKTETFSGGWSAGVRSAKPTLAWELFLLGGDAYADSIDSDNITYDLRIFDEGRLAYEVRGIQGNTHRVTQPLENCLSLAWAVRPVYRVDGKTRAGAWMNYRSGFDKFWNNDASQEVPKTPGFWEHYARLRTRCTS
jgi:hypothetical protein